MLVRLTSHAIGTPSIMPITPQARPRLTELTKASWNRRVSRMRA
jgi:hypothetical protein